MTLIALFKQGHTGVIRLMQSFHYGWLLGISLDMLLVLLENGTSMFSNFKIFFLFLYVHKSFSVCVALIIMHTVFRLAQICTPIHA
jgi:hypothetical protein